MNLTTFPPLPLSSSLSLSHHVLKPTSLQMENKPPPAKPLSDQTNFTVPTSTALFRLKSSLFNSRPTNPNPNFKPPYSKSASKKLISAFSESETSVGSSNSNPIDRNPISVSTPRRVPLTDIGNRSGGVFGPVYGRKEATEKTKLKGKQVSLPLSINSSEKLRVKPYDLRKEKREDVGKVNSKMPISCTSVAITRNKKKENDVPFSCPPLPRAKKKRNVSSEVGIISLTASHPKRNKKKRHLSMVEDKSVLDLPREYVEQQKAYFKEIDDFELAEEVASENESE